MLYALAILSLLVGYLAGYAWLVGLSYIWFGEGMPVLAQSVDKAWLEPARLYGAEPVACLALIVAGHWLLARSGRRLPIDALAEWYARALRALLAVAVGVLIFPVSLQIFSRYTELIPSYIWTEEMARFLFVWMVMIGAMLGIRETRHFEVDVWPRLAPRPQAALRLVTNLAVLAFAMVFVGAGIQFTAFAWNRISELAELPLWMIHVAWPIAGATWLVFNGEQSWDNLRTLVWGAPLQKQDDHSTESAL